MVGFVIWSKNVKFVHHKLSTYDIKFEIRKTFSKKTGKKGEPNNIIVHSLWVMGNTVSSGTRV